MTSGRAWPRLSRPIGFSIDDRQLKRAGLDYWDKVFQQLFASWDDYLAAYPDARRWMFSARATTGLYGARFQEGDHLIFGSETSGLPSEVTDGGEGTLLSIPMLPERRSLNLSTSVGIATYEALRQLRFS